MEVGACHLAGVCLIRFVVFLLAGILHPGRQLEAAGFGYFVTSPEGESAAEMLTTWATENKLGLVVAIHACRSGRINISPFYDVLSISPGGNFTPCFECS
jgi:hypothetical protein